MNKKNLIKYIRINCGVSETVARKTITHTFKFIEDNISEGVLFKGFGSFGVKQHSTRKGFNPVTLEPMIIKGFTYPKFTPSSCLINKIKKESKL